MHWNAIKYLYTSFGSIGKVPQKVVGPSFRFSFHDGLWLDVHNHMISFSSICAVGANVKGLCQRARTRHFSTGAWVRFCSQTAFVILYDILLIIIIHNIYIHTHVSPRGILYIVHNCPKLQKRWLTIDVCLLWSLCHSINRRLLPPQSWLGCPSHKGGKMGVARCGVTTACGFLFNLNLRMKMMKI